MELTPAPRIAEPQLGPDAAPVIPPGYKQTEVGVIPKDWEVNYIGNLADISTGSRNTQDRVEDGEYPFFVRSQTVERINSYSYDGEAVLTAGDGVGTGKVFHYINGKFDVHQRVYRITDFVPSLDGYFFYLFFASNFYDRIMQMTAKSSVDSVRMDMIAKMAIPVPPLAEQQAIAAALGDADAYIDALAKRIAKQRLVKQGAMQELLTGKRRLPGFVGMWETLKLRDLLSYERPDAYIVHNTEYTEHGQVPVLTANKSFILGYTIEDFGICSEIPVIVFDDFTTDCKYVDFPFKVKSSAIKLLRPKHDRISLRFLFERMQLIRFPLGDHKRYYISEYQDLDLSVPGFAEQTAIAAVLSDMDAAIEALEAKLAKARLVKQGMMQALLTGRVRLV
jgi:type I restriction enzyme S subunit